MSSGQKAWAEEIEQARHEGHVARLEALGFEGIAKRIDSLSNMIMQFERANPVQSRQGWQIVDGIKKICTDLS